MPTTEENFNVYKKNNVLLQNIMCFPWKNFSKHFMLLFFSNAFSLFCCPGGETVVSALGWDLAGLSSGHYHAGGFLWEPGL